MTDASGDVTFSDGYVVPITGLLAFLFALMAGMSVFPALSGSPGDLVLPIIFGAASLVCLRVRSSHVTVDDDT